MDSVDGQRIEELGSANLFICKDGVIKTPKLSGSILDGVTRNSVCRIAKDVLGIKVEETDIRLDELLEACLLYTSPSPRDLSTSRMPSSA